MKKIKRGGGGGGRGGGRGARTYPINSLIH
jgi:hypothetical protein